MNEIRLVLKQAAGRLLAIDLLRTLTVCMSGVVGALIIALFAQRLFGVQIRFPGDWLRLLGILAAAAVVVALVWSLIRRARGIALARELDERADLKESLSTAMWASAKASDDPWAHAVVETARDRATRVDVRRAIPITAPRLWPLPFAMALSLAILWFSVPTLDLLGLREKRQEVAQAEQAIIQAKAESSKVDELEEKLRKAGLELSKDEAAEEGAEQNAPKDPDEIRRAAIKRLTNLTDKLSDMKSSEKAEMQALKEMMKQLKQPGPGPMDQLSKAMAQGDFKKAQEELGELSKQLSENSMSAEQKEQLQKQLEKLQQQMQELAKQQENIAKQLEQAGMSKEQAQKAAKDPEALQKALEELKNLSEEQKQELAEKVAAQMKAASQCNSMGECLSQMAAGMSQSGMSPEGMEGMEGLAGQLSEMEMAMSDLESLDAAAQEAMNQLAKLSGNMGKPGNCEGGNCAGDCEGGSCSGNNPWKAGQTAGRQGAGSGGPGQGFGGGPETVDSPVSIEKVKSKSKQTDGPIIGTRLVYGEQIRGESKAQFLEAVEASAKAATEAISENEVPRELHPAIKHYFGRLRDRAEKR